MFFKNTEIAFKVKSQGQMSPKPITSRGTTTHIPTKLSVRQFYSYWRRMQQLFNNLDICQQTCNKKITIWL